MTSNEDRAARLAAIAGRAANRTPGRWRWRGNASGHFVALMAIDRLADYVLSFRRWGLQGTVPWFQRNPKESAGIERAKLIPRTHYDQSTIVGIDHPDARFIEHSRADIDFLLGEVGTLRAALAALVNDDLNAWGASIYESHWECNYCNAEGADICDEPRVRDHKADCPWLAARALVGHTVPTEEVDDGARTA